MIERATVRERGGEKTLAAEETLVAWQRRWDDLRDKAQWTKKLIPNITAWTTRKFGEVNHHLTQILTGHGCFQAYLHRCKIVRDGQCKFCQENADTAEHTLFYCPRWEEARKETTERLRSTVTTENFTQLMLRNEESWNELAALVNNIMTDKLEQERTQEAGE